jgi:hypothetical protein
MQGSTPLDVAAASVIDNNELALALQEQDLEKVWPEETWSRPTVWAHAGSEHPVQTDAGHPRAQSERG